MHKSNQMKIKSPLLSHNHKCSVGENPRSSSSSSSYIVKIHCMMDIRQTSNIIGYTIKGSLYYILYYIIIICPQNQIVLQDIRRVRSGP